MSQCVGRLRSHEDETITSMMNVQGYNGSNYNYDVGPFVKSAFQKSMCDHPTPGYDRRIAAGDIINSTMSFSSLRESAEGASVVSTYSIAQPQYWSYFSGGSVTEHWLPGFPAAPEGLDGTSVSAAKLAALANMDKTEYAFGEDLGEIGQTIRFLKNPIQHLTKLTKRQKDLEKSLKRKGATDEKAAADSYAAYQWAYKPLVRSVEDLTTALMTQIKARKPRYSARGKSVVSNEYTDDSYNDIGRYTYKIDKSVRTAILYENHRNDNDLLKKYGLRFKDAPETAWQLFPLSFMIDRVVNISDVIRASQNLLDTDLKILAASVTIKTLITETKQLTNLNDPLYVQLVTGDVVTREKFTMTRSIWQPTASDLIPPVRPAELIKDVQSILDLTTLITQRIIK